jgi:hypothetical protein
MVWFRQTSKNFNLLNLIRSIINKRTACFATQFEPLFLWDTSQNSHSINSLTAWSHNWNRQLNPFQITGEISLTLTSVYIYGCSNITLSLHIILVLKKTPSYSIRFDMDTLKASWNTVCFLWHSWNFSTVSFLCFPNSYQVCTFSNVPESLPQHLHTPRANGDDVGGGQEEENNSFLGVSFKDGVNC